MPDALTGLLVRISKCQICTAHLPHGPRPVLQAGKSARVLIVGQAPGIRVHRSGLPFDDPSGDRLRTWLGIGREVFYDPDLIAIIPMGFCYPGTGASGDLPPRPECAREWRQPLLSLLPKIELTLLLGQYAQAWHWRGSAQRTLTERVRDWRQSWPTVLPLPHPSPRNNIWLKKNPWFEEEVVPELSRRVAEILPRRSRSPGK